MKNANTPLLNREDTFLGVCEGLGTDIGIPPTLLRLAFAAALFFQPVATIAAYFALAVLVYAMRWLMPDRAAATAEAPVAQNDTAGVTLRQAA